MEKCRHETVKTEAESPSWSRRERVYVFILLFVLLAVFATAITLLSVRLAEQEHLNRNQQETLSLLQSQLLKAVEQIKQIENLTNGSHRQLKNYVQEKSQIRSSFETREVLSDSTLASILNHVKGLQGPIGPPGPVGPPGRDGRDATNLIAIERHINTTIASSAKLEMDKVRLAASEIPTVAGAVYVRWGRELCPTHSALVYRGRAAGTSYDSDAGSSSYICLPDDPEYLKYSGAPIVGLLSGVEYENPSEIGSNLQDHNAPCAVCQAANRPQQVMIPAKVRCPDSSWTLEYKGFLMSEFSFAKFGHSRTEYVCVDSQATGVVGQSANTGGALWYHQAVDCKTLGFCPPYYSDRQLSCVVCSR